jgi:hypothetical protein
MIDRLPGLKKETALDRTKPERMEKHRDRVGFTTNKRIQARKRKAMRKRMRMK